jgi:Tol biopolymer transport system component
MLIFGENKGRNMNTKLFFALIFTFIFIGCPDDEECTTCPPPVGGDSLVVTETFVTNGIHPAISPDGKKLAFSINGDIYTCDTNGFNAQQLTSTGDYDMLPRWHPDGKTIGFVRNDGTIKNEGMLYTIDTNGVVNILIADYPVADSLLVWSSVTVPIWDWSPDGNVVAFLSNQHDTTFVRLFSYLDRREVKSIFTYTRFPSGPNNISGFAFSPSGSQLIFTGLNNRGSNYLYKTTVSNDTAKQLIPNTFLAAWPSWTNQENLFSVSLAGMPFVIFNENGNVTKELRTVQKNPKWSPHGKYLLSEATGRIGGANGYEFSMLSLNVVEDDKSYNLTNNGDEDTHNYFFTWNSLENTIYYQKFKKIYKISFFFKKSQEVL